MVDRLKAGYDVEVEWRPFEIHPETPPEGRRHLAEVRASRAATFERLKERAREYGMGMVMPELSPNSHRALEAAEYAREMGLEEPFHRAVFGKLFAEGMDIYRWEVLRTAAQEAGLDPDEMQAAVETGRYGAVVDRRTAEAQALGLTGVPAFIFDGRYSIVGAQPFGAFEQMMRRLGR